MHDGFEYGYTVSSEHTYVGIYFINCTKKKLEIVRNM